MGVGSLGPGLSRAGTVTYPRCGGCQVSVGYRRAWCLAIAHLYSYAQMANFVRAGHRKRFCPSLCLPACLKGLYRMDPVWLLFV